MASAISKVKPPLKTLSRRKKACSSGVEQVVAPGDRIAHGLQPFRQIARSAAQHGERVVQPHRAPPARPATGYMRRPAPAPAAIHRPSARSRPAPDSRLGGIARAAFAEANCPPAAGLQNSPQAGRHPRPAPAPPADRPGTRIRHTHRAASGWSPEWRVRPPLARAGQARIPHPAIARDCRARANRSIAQAVGVRRQSDRPSRTLRNRTQSLSGARGVRKGCKGNKRQFARRIPARTQPRPPAPAESCQRPRVRSGNEANSAPARPDAGRRQFQIPGR